MAVRPGYAAVSPYVFGPEAEAVLEFAVQVFEAEPVGGLQRREDGSLMHAALKIGDGMVMVGGSQESMTAMIHIYVDDVDAVFERAVAAGGEVVRPVKSEGYGDRSGGVRDAGGNIWWITSYIGEG